MNNKLGIKNMDYRLEPLQTVQLIISAKDQYSPTHLLVNNAEVYEFYCDPEQRWKDWFIKCDANGFFNLFATLAGLRVKQAKCFCLCGSYNNDERQVFRIGASASITTNISGYISFFANDSFNYYNNNRGSITLNITRAR